MEGKSKILIIVGSAPCVTEDLVAAANELRATSDELQSYMLIGLDAVDKYIFDAKYFATYHPSDIQAAGARRAAIYGNTDYKVIAHQPHIDKATGRDLVDLIIPFQPPTGSSALLGVLAGIQLGYEKIIVCGCPLTGCNDKAYDYANFRAGWTAKLSEIKDKARSMSGWTKELLGSPTQEWLMSPAGGGGATAPGVVKT